MSNESTDEVYLFLTDVMETFVRDIRGDDYEKWPIEYGYYIFDRLKEIKPDIANAIVGTISDPRVKGVTDSFYPYLRHVWNYDFNKEGN